MTRRYGKRFLGNNDSDNMEVHDLDNEKTQCQIDKIIRAGHIQTFDPDTLEEAHRRGYDNCHYCLGESER